MNDYKSIVFFDYKKLHKEAKGIHGVFLDIFDKLSRNKVLIPSKVLGASFLLRPRNLLISNVDPLYKLQSIFLASKRSYSDFSLYGTTGLDMTLYPEISLAKVINNPLISVVNTTIYFNTENK
jgi:hypothetical protein